MYVSPDIQEYWLPKDQTEIKYWFFCKAKLKEFQNKSKKNPKNAKT